ncbi:DNA-directed primase/polymerase protein isoform X1 [Artibeus jamaicensis]|uniref:DNA-directed primase/polymerase protein isoform X1 n=1 Tax=Artibeus jamaicensis TaxID=9417 RepID=UPI00235AD31E|nr:DNA-directed primase/polymerase protein isoform X1 [Artibeus jamaicensis]XP_053515880.1 DNA-directed primase/polymerase protein isoform X1 [Artibeus jamaicensis]XP_053515881.1 DNA-directed primase/polymerase protein isoform X1 [Artibeus jamaicensis]XP_053515882.1 DNA-directed primase/polymerase protein isoform X1 [Artibeus jamaicensis]XP_053515883.1 DNA-directed primase/polymerase protein isoform X1 [Artibeus jamaicensis]XP_053515884.1 DNA-directed primase/polymerase protein isoform X1 [Art
MKRKWEAKLKQIEEQASHYEQNPLPSVYRPRLSKPGDPSPVWKLFPRQAQAFNFVKSCKEDVHVFALEHEVGEGQRVYLVTTYVEFWFYYKSRKNLLHCYEVIPENAVCKLYFDLEFNKVANPGADGKKMVALLIEYVCKALQELYRVNCSAEDVLNLDSSTDAKFSRHLIFQLRDVAFKDNIHVGNFVRTILQPAFHLIASEDDEDAGGVPETAGRGPPHFSGTPVQQGASCSSLSTAEERGESWTRDSGRPEGLGSATPGSPDLSFLVVKNASGEKCLFVDLGVYTRNRNFRLYKSSKIGKLVVLEIAEDNTFSVPRSNKISEENQYFLSSLVSNVRFSATLRILTCDTPMNKQKQPGHFNSTTTSVENIEGFQASPYPEIDQFVLSLVNKNGIKGGIRCWNYFFREQLLVFDICKYRWCENIGRAHKSNNIMIVVDLKNEVWYQKCHDPECQAVNFKSDRSPLPAEVRLSFLLEEEEEFTTDETMNNKTKSPQKPPSSVSSKTEFSDADWDDGIDDTCFLEATEDAELAEAAENSHLDGNSGGEEIPDELLVEVYKDS